MRARPFALLLVTLVLVTGCQVSGSVGIEVATDGSGRVSVTLVLDDQAQARVGDLETELKLDDLRDAGWTIAAPRHTEDRWEVTASKPFGSPDDLQQVLDEVGGPDGVFRGWTVELSSGFGSQELTVGGQVVLSGALDQFSDAELAQSLDGLALGRTPEELASELGEGGSIPLTVTVEVPGEVDEATGGDPEVADGSATWSYAVPGPAVDERLSVTSSDTDSTVYVWFAAAGLCVVLAAMVWVMGRMRRARH